jgi:hypothetical protein
LVVHRVFRAQGLARIREVLSRWMRDAYGEIPRAQGGRNVRWSPDSSSNGRKQMCTS